MPLARHLTLGLHTNRKLNHITVSIRHQLNKMIEIQSLIQSFDGSGNKLELLVCSPPKAATSPDKPPILFIHGAFCSAHDYQFFLPYFASNGYPAYSLSFRGHGKSWTPSWLSLNLLTTMGHHAADVKAVLQYIRKQNPDAAQRPILFGHSFGGGYLQHLLATEAKANGEKLASSLVLLGSAPLWGGAKQIMSNWEEVETDGKGYPYPWSPRSQLDTAKQVRDAFFRQEASEEVVKLWIETCRTKVEGLRTGLAAFWPFGEAKDILAGIEGLKSADGAGRRKILCVAAENDRLVREDMSEKHVAELRKGCAGGEMIKQVMIPDSGHHLMMDSSWKRCADEILSWMHA